MKVKSMLMNIKLQKFIFSYCYVVKLSHCDIVETMAASQLPANFYFRQGRIETGPGHLSMITEKCNNCQNNGK